MIRRFFSILACRFGLHGSETIRRMTGFTPATIYFGTWPRVAEEDQIGMAWYSLHCAKCGLDQGWGPVLSAGSRKAEREAENEANLEKLEKLPNFGVRI